MIRDRDRIYRTIVTRRLRAMGIRDKPIAPASPWQNGFAERLIGSIRRECLDHVIVWARHICVGFCNPMPITTTPSERIGLCNRDAPISRPIHQTGIIRSHPILGGLHHHYVRV
jgi:transposase InsO family protein